jgi:hypothetical protein
VPTWVVWATAAAILVSVGGLSYVLSSRLLHKKELSGPAVVRNTDGDVKDGHPRDGRDQPARDNGGSSRVVEKDPKPQDKPDPVVKDGGRKTDKKNPPDKRRPPRKDNRPTGPHDWLASGENPELRPITIPNLSVYLPLRDLEQKEAQGQLLAKFHREDAVQVKLVCRDTRKGVKELRAFLGRRGIKLIEDPDAKVRLKSRRYQTTFAVCIENVKPNELMTLLRLLSRADQAAAARNQSPEQFGDMIVSSLQPDSRKEYAKVLGAPPQVRRTEVKGPAPQAGKVQRVAMLLALPINPKVNRSQEVKQFRAGNRERLQGTLQVVLVLS